MDDLIQSSKFWMLGHNGLDPVVKNIPSKQERSQSAQDITKHNNGECKGHWSKEKPCADSEERSWEEEPACDCVKGDEQDGAHTAVVIDITIKGNTDKKFVIKGGK